MRVFVENLYLRGKIIMLVCCELHVPVNVCMCVCLHCVFCLCVMMCVCDYACVLLYMCDDYMCV